MTDKKIALITGATRGIGAAIAVALKNSGHHVIANYKNDATKADGFAKTKGFDVSDFDAVQTAIAELIETHGKIDILVNNAGITRDGFTHKMAKDDWYDVINVNLSSSFNTARAVLPTMREQGWGRIINISSINAQKGQLGQANYAAAKAGLIGLTKSLALENARKGITANVVAPGYTETEMTAKIPDNILESIVAEIPVGRMGKPEEIAQAVRYLTTEEAAFVTGSVLSVNGGHYMAS